MWSGTKVTTKYARSSASSSDHRAGYLFLGEKVTILQIIGGLVMLLPVFLMSASGVPAATGPKR